MAKRKQKPKRKPKWSAITSINPPMCGWDIVGESEVSREDAKRLGEEEIGNPWEKNPWFGDLVTETKLKNLRVVTATQLKNYNIAP